MCSTTEDDEAENVGGAEAAEAEDGAGRPMPRRGVLAGMAALPIFAMLPQAAARASEVQASTGGVVRSALHVHTSFSEGSSGLKKLASRTTVASMESQVATLAALGADLCFFTDHDHRMAGDDGGIGGKRYPSLEDMPSPHWTYVPDQTTGAKGGTTAMTSRGLEASVTAGSEPAWRGMFVDCYPTGRDYRTTMAGMSLAVSGRHLSSTGWTEVRIRASFHPARSGRPAGSYEVHYRLNPQARARSVVARGLTAVVTVPIEAGATHRTLLTPVADLRAAFPDFGSLASDNGLYGVWIGAGAPAGGSAETLVTQLELIRALNGPEALTLQHNLMSDLGSLYPGLALGAGLEASYATHLNLFSPTPSALTFNAPQAGETQSGYLKRLVRTIRTAGGVASYNHPFGASIGKPLTGAARADRLARVARGLLANGLYGCEVLEVGYELRGSMDVTGHLDLWDILLSAGMRVMADGVSDDHAGTPTSWTGGTNHYFTDVISPSSDPAQVAPLLGQGRAFVSLRTGFAGMLDLACDGVRMGGSRSGSGRGTDINVTADGLPSNGTLRVIQVGIHGDATRVTPPTPRTDVQFAASTISGGQVTVRVPNALSYVRAEVLNGAGTRVAFSNPLCLTPTT